KIERFEVFGVAMPLIGTFTSGGISKNATKCAVVRLTASDGTIGISSIEPSASVKSPGTAAELIVTLRERVGPAVVGLDPMNINRLIERLDALTPTQPGAGAAGEMACVELVSRIQGVPIYTYLGGAVQDSVQFNGWIGMLPPEEAATEALRWLKAGFRSAKIKVGSGVEADRDRIEAVRAAVGSAMQLRIDANTQYDADTSLKLCRMVKQFDLQLFEQPAPKDDIAGLARVRREGGIPVMADESVSDHASLVAVIKAGAADFVKFGVKQAGGILRAARMLATAEAAGLPVVIGHGFGLDPSTLAEIMVAASSRNVLPGLECVGPLKVVDTVATTRLDISSGSLPLPGGPGLGISLDEAKLEQYRLK
ncbi:MAG TPA: enolase C-terminal domain-like protein, partial [Burkholderiales bacterium]|nr:enolase C-terminal domain-like protein [Burkholderiales bacterium]